MSDNTKERKATDVLLDLESKIDAMQQTVNSLAFDIKLILAAVKIKNSRPMFEQEKPTVSAPIVSTVTAPSFGPNVVMTNAMVYSDNKPVRLAKVEIFDLNNMLVTSTMTNHTGKWTATLKPGTYNIKMTKGSTADKQAVTHKYQLDVTEESQKKEIPIITV